MFNYFWRIFIEQLLYSILTLQGYSQPELLKSITQVRGSQQMNKSMLVSIVVSYCNQGMLSPRLYIRSCMSVCISHLLIAKEFFCYLYLKKKKENSLYSNLWSILLIWTARGKLSLGAYKPFAYKKSDFLCCPFFYSSSKSSFPFLVSPLPVSEWKNWLLMPSLLLAILYNHRSLRWKSLDSARKPGMWNHTGFRAKDKCMNRGYSSLSQI